MTNLAKLLIGGAVTSLLAWGSHAVTGERFVGNLESGASAALTSTGLDGASVAMKADGALSRVAVLSGDLDDAARAKAEAAVLAVPGISSVVWADGGAAGMAAAPAAEAEAAVAACQTGVDQAVAGKVINFRSGSAYMPDASLTIVQEVADALKGCDAMALAVGGHTDATGNSEINQTLSQARADAVAAALTERGIAAERITATGYGSTQPKMPGDSVEANDANRRIEFTVSGSAAAAPAAEGE